MSGFLVINTISAILAQQTRQIGIMKAVGARDRQVAGVYFGIVLGYALLALLVALPMGALGGWLLTSFTAGLLNFEATIVLRAARGDRDRGRDRARRPAGRRGLAGVPRRPGHGPRGDRVGRASGDGFGRSRFDRALQSLRGFSRPTLLSIRNTFRRKSRLVLTLLALTFGGAVFMSVFTLRASLLGHGRGDAGLLQLRRPGPARGSRPGRRCSSGRRSRCRGSRPPSRGRSRRRSGSAPTTRPAATSSCSACPTARRPSAR